MSAKPEVIGEIAPVMARVPESVMNAVVEQLESNELEIESLKKQRAGLIAKNAVLQEQVIEAQLQAAHAIAVSKFSEAQMYQRVLALETLADRIANHVQGLPQRDELEAVVAKLKQVGQDYYNHSAQCRC